MPLRFAKAGGRPAGAFEIYLSYRPIAAACSATSARSPLLLAIGLALLWAILYRIVARASRRLRRQADENYRLARYDPLTGLPNRTLFVEELAARRRRARRSDAGARGPADRPRALQRDQQHARRRAAATRSLREVGTPAADGCVERRRSPRASAATSTRCCARTTARTERARARAARGARARSRRPSCSRTAWRSTSRRASASRCSASTPTTPTCCSSGPTCALAHARSHGSRLEVYSPRMRALRRRAPEAARAGARRARESDEFTLHYQPKVDLQTAAHRRRRGARALAPPASSDCCRRIASSR